MASNRFDTSVGQQYVSQYTPLPFEAMYKVGAGMQQNYDNNLAETYKLNDALSLVPAIHDPQLGLSNLKKKQDLDNEFHPKVEALTAKIMAGDPNAKQELKKLERDWINNPVRQELENSYLNYKAYKEDKTKKGDKYAVYKDAYQGQSLIDENGELKPFRFSGMGEVQDHASEARDQMKDIAKMGYDSKNSQIGADGNIYTRDSHGKYIKDTRVWDLANQKAYDFVKTQKGKDFEDLVRYENPNASEQDVHKRVTQYLFNAGSNQIFSDVGGGSDVEMTGAYLRNLDKQDEESSFNRLPMHELPVSTQDVKNPLKTVFGLEKPELEYNSGSIDRVDRAGNWHYGDKPSGKKEVLENLTKYYTGMSNTAKNLGIQIPKTKDGKTDYDKLQQVLTDVSNHMLKNGQVGQGLQTELSNNISSYYLGTIDSKGDGFKKSPFLETAKITETGNPSNQIVDDEGKSKIAENGVIKDINFYAEQPGTFVITTNDGDKSKNYDIYLGEKVSKALIEPTWNLTKSFERNAKGEIKPQETKQLQNTELSIGNTLSKQYENIQDPKLKQYLLNTLKSTLSETKDMKTTQIVNSAERLNDGSPKYVFIGKQGFDSENNKPIEKVIAINKSNGNVELMDLNEVQAMESSFIQKQISTGYKPKLAKDKR